MQPAPSGLDHRQSLIRAEDAERRATTTYNLISTLRLAAALLLLIAGAAAFKTPGALPITLIGFSGGSFLLLALWHASVDEQRTGCQRLAAYHKRGLERQDGRWDHAQDDGARFAPPDHPFAWDLDVVGKRSLFALLNTSSTAGGTRELARLLLDDTQPVDSGRSKIVADLAERHDWRARLFAVGTEFDPTRCDDDAFTAWLKETPRPDGTTTVLLLHLLRLAALAALAYAFWQGGGGVLLLTFLAISALFSPIDQLAKRAFAPIADADRFSTLIKARARCLRHSADLAATNPSAGLADLASRAGSGAGALGRLARIAEGMTQQSNPIWAYGVGAVLLARWRDRQRLQRWASRHGQDYAGWISALDEIDSYSCLATYAAEQKGCWPTWSDRGPVFTAEQVAHPLLPSATRVANSLSVSEHQVLLLTGANASGKSTFLRTVMLAAVLARAGTTVPASTCQLRPMRLASVMRVQDSIDAGVSRFQAEVNALARVFSRCREPGDPVLVALDEILGGTNSHERHLGTQAVIAQLRQISAALLISTHDLELPQLARDAPDDFQLAHFADDAGEHDNDLRFDYRLRPGVVRSTNALRVMRRAGLPVGES